MASIVLAHGAWSAAWAWKKMRPLMRAAGHEFFSPTYTGLGERDHLARPEIDLSTHIQDVLSVLEFEDLKDVTLLGHSYGGMVATGVVDKAADRIARVGLYRRLRAQGRAEPVRPGRAQGRGQHARGRAEGWRRLEAAAQSHAARYGAGRRRLGGAAPAAATDQDVRTKITLQSQYAPARHYIYAKKNGPGDVFRQFGERAKSEAGWKYYEIDASHNPHITCPDVLMALLTEIMAAK